MSEKELGAYYGRDHVVYVYRLPEKLSDGYCFGAGKEIGFTNVDWFSAPKELKFGDIQKHVKWKRYIVPGRAYLVLIPARGDAFMFLAEKTELREVK